MDVISPLSRIDSKLVNFSCDLIKSSEFDFSGMDPIVFRESVRVGMVRDTPFPAPGIARVFDQNIPGIGVTIPVRIYRPEGKGPFPIMMFFHGGGWVAGDLDIQDTSCRLLCSYSGFVVVSVDYRLAPEHPFPAAPDDCYAATSWIYTNPGFVEGDSSRLVVVGESAGGNLATVVCLMARDRGGPKIRHQTILYGGLQWMDWYIPGYLTQDCDRQNSYLSPLLANDLSGLPPATIVTAELDPVTPQCVAYALRLSEAGVENHYLTYKGMTHGFVNCPSSEHSISAVQKVAQLIRMTTGL